MSDDAPCKSPVSRLRRAIFTYVCVASCIGLSYSLALRGLDTKVAQTVAEGLTGLGTWLAIAYVGTSSVDYSLGMGMPAFLRKRFGGKDDDKDGDQR